MKQIIKKVIFLFFVLTTSSFSFDIDSYGDYNSRSIFANQIQQKELSQEIIDLLNSKKLYPNSKSLIQEVSKKNYENVSILLKAGVNPNQNYLGEYAIYIASKKNDLKIVKLLIENNAKPDKGFYSELYEAIKNKNENLADYLLENGSNPNYTDSITANTILYHALKNNYLNLAEKLIEKGARIDAKSAKIIAKKGLKY